MRILIYGTGAIGGLIGGRLAEAGHEVRCLARPRVVEAVRRGGLWISEDGEQRRAPESLQITADPAEALRPPAPDVAVFTMKAYDTAAALAELRAATASPPPVLCLQNGVGNEAEIAAALGAERVIAGTATTAALMPAPGRVAVERARGVGIEAGRPLSGPLRAALLGAGFRVATYPDAAALKWSKLLVNIVANPTSAITGLPAGQIFAHPGLYRLEIAALREGVRVMRGQGLRPVDLPGVRVALLARAAFLPPALTRSLLRRAVVGGRGDKMPSFYYDLERGRSEVGWLNGAIAREGERLPQVPVPVNRHLTDVLTGLASGALQREDYRGRPGVLLAGVAEYLS